MEIKQVCEVHFVEIVEGTESYGPTVTLIMKREQLEALAVKLDVYIRALDPPEVAPYEPVAPPAPRRTGDRADRMPPLPDRDPTAPHEEPPMRPACDCGADRTGPSAEAHDSMCAAITPGTYRLPNGGTVVVQPQAKTCSGDDILDIDTI